MLHALAAGAVSVVPGSQPPMAECAESLTAGKRVIRAGSRAIFDLSTSARLYVWPDGLLMKLPSKDADDDNSDDESDDKPDDGGGSAVAFPALLASSYSVLCGDVQRTLLRAERPGEDRVNVAVSALSLAVNGDRFADYAEAISLADPASPRKRSLLLAARQLRRLLLHEIDCEAAHAAKFRRGRQFNHEDATGGRSTKSGSLYDPDAPSPDSVALPQVAQVEDSDGEPAQPPCGKARPLSYVLLASGPSVAVTAVVETLFAAAEADIAAAVEAHRANVSRLAGRMRGEPSDAPMAAPLRRPFLVGLPSLARLLDELPTRARNRAANAGRGRGGRRGRGQATGGRRDPGAPPVTSYVLGTAEGAAWWAAVVDIACRAQAVMSGRAADTRPLLPAPPLDPDAPVARGAPSLEAVSAAVALRLAPLTSDEPEVLHAVAAVEVQAPRDNDAASALWAAPPPNATQAAPGVSLMTPERAFVSRPRAADAAAAPRTLVVASGSDAEELVHPLASVAQRWGSTTSQPPVLTEGGAAAAITGDSDVDSALVALRAFQEAHAGDPATADLCSRLLTSIADADAAARAAPRHRLAVLDPDVEAALKRVAVGSADAAAVAAVAHGTAAGCATALQIRDACAATAVALTGAAQRLAASLSTQLRQARTAAAAAPRSAAPDAVALWEVLQAAGAVSALSWAALCGAAVASNGAALVRAVEPLVPADFIERTLLPGAVRVMMLHAGALHAAGAAATAAGIVAQLGRVAAAGASHGSGLAAAATLLEHALAALTTQVFARRSSSCYVVRAGLDSSGGNGSNSSGGSVELRVTPQFAYAEFMLCSLLRPGQAELVDAFVTAARLRGDGSEGTARLRQLLMVRACVGASRRHVCSPCATQARRPPAPVLARAKARRASSCRSSRSSWRTGSPSSRPSCPRRSSCSPPTRSGRCSR